MIPSQTFPKQTFHFYFITIIIIVNIIVIIIISSSSSNNNNNYEHINKPETFLLVKFRLRYISLYITDVSQVARKFD